jgi:glycosyltransferase involved in cell wall biosynthesis
VNKPRILFIDHLRELGGSEINLLGILAQIDRQSFDPVVSCPEGPLAERIRGLGLPFFPLRIESRWSATNMMRSVPLSRLGALVARGLGDGVSVVRQLRALIGETRPDLLYLNTLKAGVLGGIAGRLSGVPIIEHVQDIIRPAEFSPLWLRVMSGSLRWLPHLMITPSDAVRTALVRLGVPAGRIRRVYNGVALDRFDPTIDPIAARRRLGLEPDLPAAGIVARLMRWKGQGVFLEAAARVRTPARFLVVGGLFWEEPTFEAELREQARRLGIENRVVFLGHRDEVPEVMAALDVLVHASTHPEPFGLTIIEAMAAGRPVIAARDGGAMEIVEEGATGLLSPPGDPAGLSAALDRLLSDPGRRRTLGSAGRRRAEGEFDIGHTTRRIEDCIRQVLDGSSLRQAA